MPTKFQPGQVIATWILERRLGAGAFGEVWVARHVDFGEVRAVKIPTDPEFVRQLRKEGRIQHTLRHANIVPVLDMNSRHDPPYMVMEYFEGQSLREVLKERGKLTVEESLKILRQVLDAMAFAHGQGALHRDLKPENLLIAADGTVKVTDFGLGKVQEEVVRSLILSGSLETVEGHSVSGTIEYMSPEQRQGEEPGPRDDIYALGIVACELLTGKRPAASGVARVLERGGVPAEVAAWVEKACDEREYRFADGAEMLRELPSPAPAKPTSKSRTESTPPKPEPRPSPPRVSRPSPQAVPSQKGTSPAKKAWAMVMVSVLMAIVVGIWMVPWGQKGGGMGTEAGKAARPAPSSPIETTPKFDWDKYRVASPEDPRSTAAKVASPSQATKEAPFENSLGMKFVAAGTTGVLFSMWETRVKDYAAFCRDTNRAWERPSFSQGEDHPAVNVSWDDAKAFCEWLTKREGRTYRLPTDAEWSVAVGLENEGSGSPKDKDVKIKSIYPWGTQWPPPHGAGNYTSSLKADDFEYTSPVGSFAPNRYGLFDMGGNVWEWCEDFFDGCSGARVLRGASWLSDYPDILLSSYRISNDPGARYVVYGFRCVLVGGGFSR